MFKEGLHFIGEWHTHPQVDPIPSQVDLYSMRDSFLKSKHELEAFVLIIVGTKSPSLSLWISKHNEEGFKRLQHEEVGANT